MNALPVSVANRIQYILSRRPARVTLVVITSVAYALAYLPLRARIGDAAGLLAFVPVMLCAWWYGLRGGLIAGLATPLANTLLLNLAGHPGWDVIFRETAGLGPLAAIALGAIVGRWSDLARALQLQIVQHRQTQQALQESVERFRRLAEASTEGIAILDDGQILDANPALAAMYGYELAELVGQDATTFAAPGAQDQVALNIRSGQERPYEAVGVRKDGTTFPAEIIGRAIRYEGRTARVTIIHDLTERRRAEAALHDSEQRYRALWEAAQRQTQELTLLDRVRQALARELELPQVIRTVVEGIAETFGYTLVSLYLLDGDQLQLQHQVGYAQVIERVPVSQGISGRVVRTGQPVLLEDVRTDAAFLGAVEGIASEVCVPLSDQGRVVGIINVESTQGVQLTQGDLRLMLALSEQVGIALGRARLYAEMRESEQRFENAVQYAAIGMALVAPDGRYLKVNQALCRLVGYSAAELLATSFQAITHPDDLEADLEYVRQLLAGEIETYQMEKRYFHHGGQVVWALLSVSLVRDHDHRPLYLISQIQDVTERKQAETALRESENRYRSLFENMLEGYAYCQIVLDEAGRPDDFIYLDVNRAFEALSGLQDVAGRRVSEVIPGIRQANPEVFEIYGRVALTGQPERHETYVEGLHLWLTLAVYCPRPGYFVAVFDNITVRKQAEVALHESQEQYRRIVEQANDIIYRTDANGYFTFVNPAALRVMQYTEAELIGRHFLDLIRPDHREAAMKFYRSQLARHLPNTYYEFPVVTKEGLEVWIGQNVQLIEAATTTTIQALARDITERRQAEAALQRSEAQFRAIVESSHDGIIFTDSAGGILYRSPSYRRINGYANDERVGHSGFETVHPEDLNRTRQTWTDILQHPNEPQLTEYRIQHKDGSWRWIETSALNLLANPHVEAVVLASRDITERKRAEAALRDSEMRYRGLFEDSPIALWEEDFSAVKVRLDALREQGVTDFRVYFQAHPSIVAECAAQVKVTDVNAASLTLYRASSKADLLAKFERVFTPESYGSFMDELVNIAEGQLAFERQTLNQSLAGEHLQLILHWAAARGHEDDLSKVIVSLLDITEREQAKQALEQANARLEQWLAEAESRTRELALLNELGALLQHSRTAEDAYAVIAEVMPSLFPRMAGRLLILDPAGNWAAPVAHWGGDQAHAALAPNDCRALQHGQLHLTVSAGLANEPGSDPAGPCPHMAGQELGISVCLPLVAQEKALGVIHLYNSGLQEPPESIIAAGTLWTGARQQFARTAADSMALFLTNLNLQESLRQQATRDPLTGLFNRRYLEETLEREVARVTRALRPLGVIMLDLDHFKHFNDTFGHAAGDRLLEALGALLKASVRGEDIACRYGGEEFLLILPEAPLGVTQARANRLREAVKQLVVHHDGQPLDPITASVGVAEYPEQGRTREAVLRAADEALYQAKREGRDRVVVAQPIQSGI